MSYGLRLESPKLLKIRVLRCQALGYQNQYPQAQVLAFFKNLILCSFWGSTLRQKNNFRTYNISLVFVVLHTSHVQHSLSYTLGLSNEAFVTSVQDPIPPKGCKIGLPNLMVSFSPCQFVYLTHNMEVVFLSHFFFTIFLYPIFFWVAFFFFFSKLFVKFEKIHVQFLFYF